MLTIEEIDLLITRNNPDGLKEYYNKSYDTLKEINKRSNLISLFVLILLVIDTFPGYIKDGDISGIKISLDLIKIMSPLLIPYFLLEWCLIARRRRSLMKAIKHIGFFMFNIPKTGEENNNEFSIQTRNTMPFSFMIEFLNIKINNLFSVFTTLIILISMAIFVPVYLLYSAYKSYTTGHLTCSMEIINLIGIICIFQIFFFYYNDIKNVRRVILADREYLNRKGSGSVV